jgi:hypothetical protein
MCSEIEIIFSLPASWRWIQALLIQAKISANIPHTMTA